MQWDEDSKYFARRKDFKYLHKEITKFFFISFQNKLGSMPNYHNCVLRPTTWLHRTFTIRKTSQNFLYWVCLVKRFSFTIITIDRAYPSIQYAMIRSWSIVFQTTLLKKVLQPVALIHILIYLYCSYHVLIAHWFC